MTSATVTKVTVEEEWDPTGNGRGNGAPSLLRGNQLPPPFRFLKLTAKAAAGASIRVKVEMIFSNSESE